MPSSDDRGDCPITVAYRLMSILGTKERPVGAQEFFIFWNALSYEEKCDLIELIGT